MYEAAAVIVTEVHDRLKSRSMNNVVQGLDQRPLILFRSRGPTYGQVGAVDVGEHGSASATAVPELVLGCSEVEAAAKTDTRNANACLSYLSGLPALPVLTTHAQTGRKSFFLRRVDRSNQLPCTWTNLPLTTFYASSAQAE